MSTIIETKSSRKRMSMMPNNHVIQHTGSKPRMSMGSSTMFRRSNATNVYSAPPAMYSSGEASKASKEAVENVKGVRGKEKHTLCDLNGRLACYMERMKFMEANNKALAEECEKLRKIKGLNQARVKEEYQDEITEARKALAELCKEMAPLRAKIVTLEDKVETQENEIDGLRKQITDLDANICKLNTMLGDMEGECTTLRNQCGASDRQINMLKDDLQRCRDDNDRLRIDYEAAITKQINAENERDAINEEHEFLTDTSELEIAELRALIDKFKDIQPKIASMWQSEMKTVINELQEQFNQQLDDMTTETRIRYEEKLAQLQSGMRRDNTDGIVKSENKTLKSQLGDNKMRLSDLDSENSRLRAMLDALKEKYDRECMECEEEKAEKDAKIAELESQLDQIMADMNDLQSSKMGLELEIACYKKLLEGEENKIQRSLESHANLQSSGGADLASIIVGGMSSGGQSSGGGGQMSQSSKPVVSSMSESTGTVRVTRTSTCHITVKDVEQSGRYVTLSNSSATRDFDFTGYYLNRKSGRGTSSYNFKDGYKLAPLQEVRIYAYNFEDEMGKGDLVASQDTCKMWGVGDGYLRVFDKNNVKKAASEIVFQKK